MVLDGMGRLVLANPVECWEQWCVKAVGTERYTCLAYGTQFGVELESVWSFPTREAQESQIKRTITDALLSDPMRRTLAVRNFRFRWERSSLFVDFDVIGDREQLNLSVNYGRGDVVPW